MTELLGITVSEVSAGDVAGFRRFITVDMQPTSLVEPPARAAVIDHHPPEAGYAAEYADVRSEFGATASMMTEYLRAADAELLDPSLATALLYGIKTDTDSLMRGVSPADVEAYAFLQARADLTLLRRIERPSLPVDAARRLGEALAGLEVGAGLVLAHAGALPSEWAHLPAEIADLCLGVEGTVLAAATAVLDGELVFTLRYSGRDEEGAGAVARHIAAAGGKGGGHCAMARATLPLERAAALIGDLDRDGALLRFVQEHSEATVLSRRS